MTKRIHVSVDERRARLVSRHHLGRTAAGVLDAVRGLTTLHSTDPATPYLSLHARVPGFTTPDLDRALVEERTLWRMHAMRRTLFIVPTEGAGAYLAGAGRDIARQERRRLEGWLAGEMPGPSIEAFISEMEASILAALKGGAEMRTQDLALSIPLLSTPITLGSGKWTTRAPVSSRILFLLAMEGKIVRTRPAGSWRSSQYRWADAGRWFTSPFGMEDVAEARAQVIARYLRAHGPATVEDIRWWTGWTLRDVRAALARIQAIGVALDDGSEGLLLPDDSEPVSAKALESVSFLPALDSTPMGWKQREWYLAGHAAALFDTNGNVGPTVWSGGRVIGGWAQKPQGEVVFRLLESVDSETSARAATEAAQLERWLDGITVKPRFRTPLEKALAGS